jgi:hypothetical protein
MQFHALIEQPTPDPRRSPPLCLVRVLVTLAARENSAGDGLAKQTQGEERP